MTRTDTPPRRDLDTSATFYTTKRCCNVCGRRLGDATLDEIVMAIEGVDLPDVAAECGCQVTVEGR